MTMKKLLPLFAFLLIAGQAAAQTAVNNLVTLDATTPSAVGTQISAAILNNGTIGSSLGWGAMNGTASAMTVGPHVPGCELGNPVSISTTTYIPATPSLSFAYNNTATFSNWSAGIPAGHRVVSISVCFQANAAGIISNLFDMIGLYDTGGHYVFFQMQSSPSGGVDIETDGSGTTHSASIILTTGKTYRCTMQSNENSGTASLSCYLPTYPYTQVGSTVTAVQKTGADVTSLRWGNNEIGTASVTTYFENLTIDYTTGAFPLNNGTQYAPWAGVISPTRAIDWTKAGVIGGIPARLTICSTLSAGASLATINSAIAGCAPGQTVLLGAGSYSLNGMMNFTGHPNVTVRGAGADQTTLTFTGSAGCTGRATLVCFGSSDTNFKSSPSNLVNWTAGYTPGTKIITLASVPNLKIGFPIILDQLDDTETGCDAGGVLATQITTTCSPTSPGSTGPFSLEGNSGGSQRTSPFREQEQIVIVTGCNGSTTVGASCSGTNVAVTIADPGIYMPNWRTGQSPQAWWATNPSLGDGIENLTIDGTGSTTDQPIQCFNGANSYVKGVRIIDSYRAAWQWEYCAHPTIQDSYIFLTQSSGPTNYGVECYGASDGLILNNIIQAVTGPVLLNSACEGNVIAYNFDVNVYYTPSPGWNNPWSSLHTAGVDMNLYEGNVGDTIDQDVFHGTHNFNTHFRNYYAGNQPVCYSSGGSYATSSYAACNNNRIAIQLRSFSRFHNIVANVLGNGTQTAYATGGDRTIYAIGNGNSNGTVTVPDDANVGTTLMRWGNYDTFDAASRFVSGEVPSAPAANIQKPFANFQPTVGNGGQPAFPASLYFSAMPTWWPAGKAWPLTGPDITSGNIANVGGHANTNPAEDCYLGPMAGGVNGTSAVLTFSASTCYSSSPSGPIASFSPTSVNYSNQAVGLPSSPTLITLTNTGTATMTGIAVSLTGANPGDFSRGTTCASTLTALASCTISVIFTPTATGARSASVSVADNAPGSPQTVPLIGNALGLLPHQPVIMGSLPNGTVGIAYSSGLQITGDSPPDSWITDPTLPGGLMLNQATGILSGTPMIAGTSVVTETVVDAYQCGASDPPGCTNVSLPYSAALTINPVPPGTPYKITTSVASLTASGQVGGAVAAQSFTINDTSPTSEAFTATSSVPWLAVTQSKPATSPSPGTTITASYNTGGQVAGTLRGNIFLTMPNQNGDTFTNSPLNIPVTLTLAAPAVPSYSCKVTSTTTNREVVTITISNFTKGMVLTPSCPVTHP